MSTRVVLAEDDFLLREGIQRLFETQGDLALVGTCGDVEGLFGLVESLKPDVVLTDIRMPPTNNDEGIEAAERLRETHPAVGVLVLSQFAEPRYARKLFRNGAAGRGYLLKQRVGDLDTLFGAVRAVHAGGSVLDSVIVEFLMERPSPDSPLTKLSPREYQVLAEMAKGKSNTGIARSLFVTERAVEKHINSTFTKLDLANEHGVNRRVIAARLFLGLEAT